MVRDGVAVDPEVAAAVSSYVDGRRFNVAARCTELGISRQTFYKYLERFRVHGVEGFFPDTRRPASSPRKLDSALEDVLIAVRKREAEAGWDYGAEAVLLRLSEEPDLWPAGMPLPSRATVNRVFDARGQLAKVPQRQPRRRPLRFARDKPNELWQYDGFDGPYRLADGSTPTILHLNDDCSRVDVALQAVTSENSQDVWDTFVAGVSEFGLPAAVLNDNGTAFSGRRRGWTAAFEAQLAALHIQAITSRVAHPQTCGKNERAHQRVLKWLARQPPARDRAQLQALLDQYRASYNTRGNQVLGGLTPLQRFALGPLAGPHQAPGPVVHVTRHTVSDRGGIGVDKTLIGLGRRHAGKPALAFRSGNRVTIFVADTLTRELVIDRTRRYQPQDR